MENTIRGDNWEIDFSQGQPWGNWKLPDGRILHLPADRWSQKKYKTRGYRLLPKTESKNIKGG